jgi:hypothetical protein
MWSSTNTAHLRATCVVQKLGSFTILLIFPLLQENSLGDWWDYLFDESDESQGWFGKIFPKKWYNDDVYTNDEAAMIMNYNKLVGEQSSAASPRVALSDVGGERAAGGLLIVQVRGTDGPCITPLYQGFNSAYDKLAPKHAPSPPATHARALPHLPELEGGGEGWEEAPQSLPYTGTARARASEICRAPCARSTSRHRHTAKWPHGPQHGTASPARGLPASRTVSGP